MKKRVFIIHGWGGSPQEGWFPWLKTELENKGFFVQIPPMPDTENPKIETWVPYLNQIVGNVDENTFFVGHSIGCQTILRYLETLPNNKKIGGAVFVAGWFYLNNLKEEEKQIAKLWLEARIDFEKIRKICPKIKVFLSDNDPFDAQEANKKILKKKLGAKVMIQHNMGHFSGSDNVTKLPIALDTILDLAK